MKTAIHKMLHFSLMMFSVTTLMGVGASRLCAEELTVSKGASTRIAVPDGIRRVVVADPSIVDARPSGDGRSLLINGLSEGTSELRIEKERGTDVIYTVSVYTDLKQLLGQIKELLRDVEGLEVKIVGNRVVLTGNILTKSAYDTVAKVVEAFPGTILNMAKMNRTEMNKYVEAAILRDIGMDTVTVRVVEDTAILEGIVYSETDTARAVEMAKLRIPNVKSLLRVHEIMIETDVKFVQLNSEDAKDFGHNVLDTVDVQGTGGIGRGSPLTGLASATAALRINALLNSGSAKALYQPHLSTKSGGVGTFQSGGQKWITAAGSVGGSFQKVDFGVMLSVKPTMQGRDRILNEVTVEVSVPDTKKGELLSLEKFETKSMAMCKVGESIVLSGLIQTLTDRFSSKTPLLGDIPLLSLFFSHKGGSTTKKELVVLITPTPVFPQVASGQPYSKDRESLLKDDSAPKK